MRIHVIQNKPLPSFPSRMSPPHLGYNVWPTFTQTPLSQRRPQAFPYREPDPERAKDGVSFHVVSAEYWSAPGESE
jgi:hypothetical protein